MKKTYQKPLLEKRGKLSAITTNGAGSSRSSRYYEAAIFGGGCKWLASAMAAATQAALRLAT